MINQELKREMDMILSDPIVSAVLIAEAESVGVSPQEYVKRFLELYYKEPSKFNSILNR